MIVANFYHTLNLGNQPYTKNFHVTLRFGAVGSDVDRINEVTLRRARLVLGWVTV